MPNRLRLTRHFPVAISDDAHRRFSRFAAEARLDEAGARSFPFGTFDSAMNAENLTARLRLLIAEPEARKA